MGFRKQIGNFFGFTRAQVNAFLLLLPLIVLFIFSEPLYRRITRFAMIGSTETSKLDTLVARFRNGAAGKEKKNLPIPDSLFRFDPNLATQSELVMLGFSARLANQLIHYRDKGGRFRKPDDLLKLYAMDTGLYTQLRPYVFITEAPEGYLPGNASRSLTETVIPVFDLNQADTLQLQLLKGIGPVLARRIVKYRDALGGFVNTNQLYEVYGLDSAVVQQVNRQLTVNANFEPVLLNINEASEAQLAAHPYLSRAVARAIVTYRFQHGRFRTIADLAHVQLVPPEVYLKTKPYLTVE
ncbi:MAG: helix-hairpin-helix domain-containing protein [Flammeovirgaceae bacterium]|nr:MAG: helix-hairpin-helix domain-containing protein [Flammeovirgaceae bacterium]